MDIVSKVTFEVQADLYEKEALAEIVKENCDPYAEMGKPYSTLQLGRRVVHMARKELAKRVEVVRCKDCAVPHNKWLGCPKLRGLVPPPDFYCAFGERREGE